MGAGRRSTIEEVPARGVMGTRRCGGEPFSLRSSRRLTLQGFARGSAIRNSGRGIVLACPKLQLRFRLVAHRAESSGVSSGYNGGLAAQMGQRRPPARSLRLGERADPTPANDRAGLHRGFLTAAYAARQELLPESAIHRPAFRH